MAKREKTVKNEKKESREGKKTPRTGRKSVVLALIGALCTMIHGMLTRCGTAYDNTVGHGAYRGSLLAGALTGRIRSLRDGGSKHLEDVLVHSIALRVMRSLNSFFGQVALNVYGIFLEVYGVVSVFMYYISYSMNGKNAHGASALLAAAIMIVCAVPMLLNSRASMTVISESRILHKILHSVLGVPEEKLKGGKSIGGPEFMLASAMLAIICGILTYFWHPAAIPAVFGLAVLGRLIFSHPESGVVITVAATPFLQFSKASDVVLIILISATAISYLCKLIQRRRTAAHSAECIIVLLFCIFILVSSFFSHGGLTTVGDGFVTVLTVLGGFYLTYTLLDNERILSSCTKLLLLSLTALSLAGIWNLFYNGIADGVIYSLKENVSPIFANNIIYIADSAAVFGTFAVLVAPICLAFAAKQRSIKGAVLSVILMGVILASTFIYGTYEAVFALVIEFCLFWAVYSRRSLTVLLFSAVPVVALALSYPILARYLETDMVTEMIESILPLGLPESPAFLGTVKSTAEMLLDGNLAGIGAGQHAFETIHPAYSNAVSAGASDPGSLWLQVLCWGGVGGMLCFAVFQILLCGNAMRVLATGREKKIRTETLALFCGVTVALVFGTVNCIWSDLRLLYLFWVCAGMLAAYARVGREAEEKKAAVFAFDEENTDLELRF